MKENKEEKIIDFTSSYVRVLYPTGAIKVIEDLQTRIYDPEEIDYIKAGKEIYTPDKWVPKKKKEKEIGDKTKEPIAIDSRKIRPYVGIEMQDEEESFAK